MALTFADVEEQSRDPETFSSTAAGDMSGNHYLKSCCFILSNLIMPRPH